MSETEPRGAANSTKDLGPGRAGLPIPPLTVSRSPNFPLCKSIALMGAVRGQTGLDLGGRLHRAERPTL